MNLHLDEAEIELFTPAQPEDDSSRNADTKERDCSDMDSSQTDTDFEFSSGNTD